MGLDRDGWVTCLRSWCRNGEFSCRVCGKQRTEHENVQIGQVTEMFSNFVLSPTLSSPHLEVIQDSGASSDDAMRLQLRPLTDSKGQRVPDTYTLQVGKVRDGGKADNFTISKGLYRKLCITQMGNTSEQALFLV